MNMTMGMDMKMDVDKDVDMNVLKSSEAHPLQLRLCITFRVSM